MKKLNQILLITSAILVSGCSMFSSDYKAPKVDTPTSWDLANDANYEVSKANLSDVSWWERFDDKELNQLITSALQNNNSIEVAIGNIQLAKAQLTQVYMGWVPSISLGGSMGIGNVGNFATGFNPSGLSPLIANQIPPTANNQPFNFYQGGLIPSYTVNILQQLKGADIAKANIQGARALKDSVRLTIISQVAGSYFTILALNQQLSTQKQMVSDLTELMRLLNIEYQHGYLAKPDMDQYQENLDQAKAVIPQIEDNLVKSKNALAVLVNNKDLKVDLDSSFAKVKMDGIIPVNLPSAVLQNRPDIIQAEQRLIAADANIDYARANFFPTINLTLPMGGFNAKLGDMLSPSGNFWMAQMNAVMPILNLGINALIKQAKANYYMAYYNYIQTVQTAFADVNNNMSGYSKNKEVLEANDRVYKTANSNYDANMQNYKLGYISYPETMSSKVTMERAQMAATQSKLNQIQSLLQLYQSLGGGYNYQNSEKAHKFGDSHD